MHFVYIITNTANGKLYVGKTNDPKVRWRAHKNNARNHALRWPLYAAMRKYGVDAFNFHVVAEYDTEESALSMECWYIAFYEAASDSSGYNLSPGGAGTSGYKWPEDARRRHSERLKGRVISPETRARISAGLKGVQKGIKRTDAARERMRLSHLGKVPWNKGLKGGSNSSSA
jgi:group I intron endonuclease